MRNLLQLLLLGVVFVACDDGGETPADAGVVDAGEDVCAAAEAEGLEVCYGCGDCASGTVCWIEEGDSCGNCMHLTCSSDAHCRICDPDSTDICDVRRGLCLPAAKCNPDDPSLVCQPGEICVYGDGLPQCLNASAVPRPGVCDVTAQRVIAKDGDVVDVRALGTTTAGAIVPFADIQLQSDLLVEDGELQRAVCARPEPCTSPVTLHNGYADCGTADLVVFPAIADTSVRVVVIDKKTHLPVVGEVALTSSSTTTTTPLNANGAAVFANVDSVESLHARLPGHDDVVLLTPGTRDVLLVVDADNPADVVPSMMGDIDFDNTHSNGDVELALTGAAHRLPWAVDDVTGPTMVSDVFVEGVTQGQVQMRFPRAMTWGLADTVVHGNFIVDADEGKTLLWSLGGKARLAHIGPLIAATSADDAGVLDLDVVTWLNVVDQLDHGVVSDVQFRANPTVPPDEPAQDWKSVSLNTLSDQSILVDTSPLPCASFARDGSCRATAKSALLLRGVDVATRGFVPFNVHRAHDDKLGVGMADGHLDTDVGENDAPWTAGLIRMPYAPPHDGLEGHLPVVVMLVEFADPALSAGAMAVVDGTEAFTALPDAVEPPRAVYDVSAGTLGLHASGADMVRIDVVDGQGTRHLLWTSTPTTQIQLRDVVDADDVQLVSVSAYKLTGGLSPRRPPSMAAVFTLHTTDVEGVEQHASSWATTTCHDVRGSVCEVRP